MKALLYLLLRQLNIVNSWCLMNGHEKHENSQKQHRLFCGFLCFLWLKKSRYLSAVSIAAGLLLAVQAFAEPTVHKNITYSAPNGRPQKLDLYLPESPPTATSPLIVWIHGGGWENGSKGNGGQIRHLVNEGFAIADINYRLTGEAPFPAQIIDCKSAIRFLRANAGKYNIDPERIGAAGMSAGGHLAALIGTSTGRFNEGENPGISSDVQAVAALCPPTDIFAISKTPDPHQKETITKFVGGNPLEEPFTSVLKSASPITYISGNEPPFLLIHGTHDRTVPYQQSKLLHDALKKAGVKSQLELIKGADHNLGGKEVQNLLTGFFTQSLQRKDSTRK